MNNGLLVVSGKWKRVVSGKGKQVILGREARSGEREE